MRKQKKKGKSEREGKRKTDIEEVVRVLADYELLSNRIALYTSEFYTNNKKDKFKKGINYKDLHYIINFARKNNRITPSQARKLKIIANKLEEIREINFTIPVKIIRDFLENIKIESKGSRGR